MKVGYNYVWVLLVKLWGGLEVEIEESMEVTMLWELWFKVNPKLDLGSMMGIEILWWIGLVKYWVSVGWKSGV